MKTTLRKKTTVLFDDFREAGPRRDGFAALNGVLTRAATGAADELRDCFEPLLSRPVAELSPIEHAILLLGAYELRQNIDTPYRVVINEAIELAKGYGGTDGHKFVNGVLDKLAARIRPEEVEAARQARR